MYAALTSFIVSPAAIPVVLVQGYDLEFCPEPVPPECVRHDEHVERWRDLIQASLGRPAFIAGGQVSLDEVRPNAFGLDGTVRTALEAEGARG